MNRSKSIKSAEFFTSQLQRPASRFESLLAAIGYLSVVLLLWVVFSTQVAAPLARTLSAQPTASVALSAASR